MAVRICNTSVEAIFGRINTEEFCLAPGEQIALSTSDNMFDLQLRHPYKSIPLGWHILWAGITLDCERISLTVDGTYTVHAESDALIKIRDYEYVFDKHIAYKTFVFSVEHATIARKDLWVQDEKRIRKKAKLIYLMGGTRILLPFVALGVLVSLLAGLYSEVNIWNVLEISLLFALSLRYVISVEHFNRVLSGTAILQYMQSERKEYRTVADNITQKNLDQNIGNDIYR